MHTIHIDNTEIENFINTKYLGNENGLMADFVSFVKTELIINDIKKGFDEVKLYEENSVNLTNARDFLSELKSAN